MRLVPVNDDQKRPTMLTPKALAAPAVVKSTPKARAGVAQPPTVVLLGDSLPSFMLRDGANEIDPQKLTIVDGTLPSCDGAAGTQADKYSSSVRVTTRTTKGAGSALVLEETAARTRGQVLRWLATLDL